MQPNRGLWQLGAAHSEAGVSFLEARMGSSRLAYSLINWPVDSRQWDWSLWKANFSLKETGLEPLEGQLEPHGGQLVPLEGQLEPQGGQH